ILHVLLVVAGGCYCRDAGTFHQCGSICPDQKRNVYGRFLSLLDLLFDLGNVDGLILWLALRGNLVPPAIDAETDNAQEQNGQYNFSSCSHEKVLGNGLVVSKSAGQDENWRDGKRPPHQHCIIPTIPLLFIVLQSSVVQAGVLAVDWSARLPVAPCPFS